MWGCAWGNGLKSPSGSGLAKQERSTPGGRGQHLPVPDSVVCKEMHAFVRAFSLLGCALIWIPIGGQAGDASVGASWSRRSTEPRSGGRRYLEQGEWARLHP